MKITMIKSRPQPGGTKLCYLKGVTYTLATDAEIAMAHVFVAEGAAVAVDQEKPAGGSDDQAQGREKSRKA